MNQIVASAENMVLPDLGDLSLDDHDYHDPIQDTENANLEVGIASDYHRNKAVDHPRSLNESSLLLEPPVKRSKQVPNYSLPIRSNSYAAPVRSTSAGRLPPATAITSVPSGVMTRSKSRANSFNMAGNSSGGLISAGYISSNNSVGSSGAITRSNSRTRSKTGGDNSSVGSYNSSNRTASTVSTRSEEALRKHQVSFHVFLFVTL